MRNPFYVLFSVWSLIMAIIGFWPSYFEHLVQGAVKTQFIIHIHALIFTGWIVLLFFQSLAIYRRAISTHKKWGKFGIYYGILIMITGLVTGFARRAFHMEAGREMAAVFSAVVSTRDVIVFGGMFAVAMYFRNKPLIHRIWILGASAYLLVPAVARANAFLFENNSISFYILWMLPVFFAIILDYSRKNPYSWHYGIIVVLMVIAAETLGMFLGMFS